MTRSLEQPKLRPDLLCRAIEMGHDPMWVIKDPMSRSYFHFSESEYALLSLANGKRSVHEIADSFCQQFPVADIKPSTVHQFFAEAMQKGLLTGESKLRSAKDSPAWWHRVMGYRLPGLNPSRLLHFLMPWTRWLFTSWMFGICLLLAPICILLVAIRFDQFSNDFGSLANSSAASVLWIAIAIAIAKACHELAHALACRHFGCECREMGVMLLFGIPCLYVDVSDAWMLRSRAGRMTISAAGMLAEVMLAIVATGVWLASNPGAIQEYRGDADDRLFFVNHCHQRQSIASIRRVLPFKRLGRRPQPGRKIPSFFGRPNSWTAWPANK